MGLYQHFSRRETFSQTHVQVGQVIPLFTSQVEMDCYTNNFPGLPCFKKLTADKHVLAELPLALFVIINLTRLTVGVCMKVRFKSKVTRGFSFSSLRNSYSPLGGSLTTLSCGEKSRKTSGTRVLLERIGIWMIIIIYSTCKEKHVCQKWIPQGQHLLL